MANVLRRSVVLPVTMGLATREGVFDNIPKSERFQIFLAPGCDGSGYVPKQSLLCQICMDLVDCPSGCWRNCSFLSCFVCFEKSLLNKQECPICKATQHSGVPTRLLQIDAIISEELSTHGLKFACNAIPRGAFRHRAPLFCCEQTFSTLAELQAHLQEQPSFQETRKQLLKLADDAINRCEKARDVLANDLVKQEQVRFLLHDEWISKVRLVESLQETIRRSASRMEGYEETMVKQEAKDPRSHGDRRRSRSPLRNR